MLTRTSPSLILTSFLVLLIIAVYVGRASMLVSQWIVKSHRIVCSQKPLFSITSSDSYWYHCEAPSKPCFSDHLQWIYLSKLPCLFSYSFCSVSYIHSKYMILSRLVLCTFYIGVIKQSYLFETSYNLF